MVKNCVERLEKIIQLNEGLELGLTTDSDCLGCKHRTKINANHYCTDYINIWYWRHKDQFEPNLNAFFRYCFEEINKKEQREIEELDKVKKYG